MNEEQQLVFIKLCKEEKLDPEKFQFAVESYLFTSRSPISKDIVQTLQTKPKILERKKIVEPPLVRDCIAF